MKAKPLDTMFFLCKHSSKEESCTMLKDLVRESADSGRAQMTKSATSDDVEIFFMNHETVIPIKERTHEHGIARCGMLLIGDDVYAVFVSYMPENTIVRCVSKMPFMDFVMAQDKYRGKFIKAQNDEFEINWQVVMRGIEMAKNNL